MLDSHFPIDIKGQILAKVQKKFESSAELLQDQTHHEAGKSDAKKYSEVLKANMFAYHSSRGTGTITFQSKSIEAYIQENSSIFTKLFFRKI
ncbi:hypothetical protein RhiirA4_473943 [Rhizophagus irregularis]|uniref:Uncharacterized protein n=1 Tax=Rhizophagus irregularis TaxID=588596 RepID=A0A2I1H7P4_9GLOM|nr:hypothetical protein RhiirA4_473943 [Rhizophagus irregularis]